MKPPDVLVLGVGGTLGEAWLSGFLAGAGQQGGIDFRQSAHFVGTSAASIVAARLASGRPPRRPEEAAGLVQQAPPASVSSARAAFERLARVPLDSSLPAVDAARPGRAAARATFLALLPLGRIPLDDLRARVAALGPRFDGRLRVVAVDAGTGHGVVCSGRRAHRRLMSPTGWLPRVRCPGCPPGADPGTEIPWTAASGARPTWTSPRWGRTPPCCAWFQRPRSWQATA